MMYQNSILSGRPSALLYILSDILFLLVASVLLINSVSALPLQVTNGTTIQAQNTTENSTTSIPYSQVSSFSIPNTIMGNINVSLLYAVSLNTAPGFYGIFKNDTLISDVHQTNSDIYSRLYIPFVNLTINSTDIISVRCHTSNGAYSCLADEFNVSFDYVVPSITSPANNSVQVSRTVNITWIGTSPYQYQVSQQSDFSTLLFNSTTANNYSGNLTFPVGLIYIRVKGYNEGINETNWTMNILDIEDQIFNYGGTGYNWSLNASYENTTQSPDNQIVQGWYYDNVDDGLNRMTQVAGLAYNVNNSSVNPYSGGYSYEATSLGTQAGYYNYSQFVLNPNRSHSLIAKVYEYGAGDTNRWSFGTGGITGVPIAYLRAGIATDYNYYHSFVNPPNTNVNTTILRGNEGWITVQKDFDGINTWGYINNQYSNDSRTSDLSWVLMIGTSAVSSKAYYDDIRVKPLGNDRGNLTLNEIIIPQTPKSIFKTIQVNFSGEGNVSIWINTSDGGLTYSGKNLVARNITNNQIYQISSLDNQTRGFVTVEFWGENNKTAIVQKVNVTMRNENKVSGYVHYPNGTVVNGATVLYHSNRTLTNSSGYYEFSNISVNTLQRGNTSFVAGISGFKAVDYFIESLNETSEYANVNFTLKNSTVKNNNIFSLEAERILQNLSIEQYINASGQFQSWPYNGTRATNIFGEAVTSESILLGYAQGYNETPERLELGLRLQGYSDYIINTLNMDTITYEQQNIGSSQYTHINFWMVHSLQAVEAVQPFISSSQWQHWENTYSNFSWWLYITEWHCVNWGNNVTSLCNGGNDIDAPLGNWVGFELTAESIRIKLGWADAGATLRMNNITNKISNQLRDDNYLNLAAEIGYSTNYQSIYHEYGLRAINQGYNNATWNNTMVRMAKWYYNITTVDGTIPMSGRGHSTINGYAALTYSELEAVNLFPNEFDSGEVYDKLDKQYQKNKQYYKLSNPNISNPWISYLDASALSGAEYDYIRNIHLIYEYFSIGGIYDASIPATQIRYKPFFEDKVQLFINSNNYSFWTFKTYTPNWPLTNTNWTAIESYSLGIIPMRLNVVCKWCTNYTISPVTQGVLLSDLNDSVHFIQFINTTGVIFKFNTSYFIDSIYSNYISTNYNYTVNGTSFITNNSFWVNITNLTFTNNSESILIDYYNFSAFTDDIFIYENISIGWNNTTYPINTYTGLGDIFIKSDGLTNSSVDIGLEKYNYTRGKETVNVTYDTVSNADYTIIEDSFYGRSGIGEYQRISIQGNITNTPIIVQKKIKISTTNVYGHLINNPPAIISYSPTSTFSSSYGLTQQFLISISQNTNITWKIDNITVQTNNSVSELITVFYLNSTASIGLHQVNATGCNAQGCATQLWNWTVSEASQIPPTPINLSNTSGNFWINYTWQAGNYLVAYNVTDINTSDNNITTQAYIPTQNNFYYFDSAFIIPSDSNATINVYGYIESQANSIGDLLSILQVQNVTTLDYEDLSFIEVRDNSTPRWENISLDSKYINSSRYVNVRGRSTFFPAPPLLKIDLYEIEARIDNITDSYNVSITNNSVQTWSNGSANTSINTTTCPSCWVNISVYAFNNSGAGILNLTAVSANTQANASTSGTFPNWAVGYYVAGGAILAGALYGAYRRRARTNQLIIYTVITR